MKDIISSDTPPIQTETNFQSLQEQLRIQQDEFLQLQRNFVAKTEPSTSNTFSFTQGFIIGQLSVIVIIGIFVKYFVFQDASSVSASRPNDSSSILKRRDDSTKNSKENDRLDDENNQALISSILEKTYYDVKNHSPESLDWFNVLIAQFINQIRSEALVADNIFHSLNDYLLKSNFPNYLDPIKITEIDIGDDFPIMSNCRIVQCPDNPGRIQAKIDVDLSDTITFGIETKLLINYPRPFTAALPIYLSVTLVRFSGCLCISLVNPNDEEFKTKTPEEEPVKPEPIKLSRSMSSSSTNPGSPKRQGASGFNSNLNSNSTTSSTANSNVALMLSFTPDYRLEFTIKSLIGSRAKLEDVPKISALIESRLRQWFVERCVEPRHRIIRLPSLWPSQTNKDNVPEKD